MPITSFIINRGVKPTNPGSGCSQGTNKKPIIIFNSYFSNNFDIRWDPEGQIIRLKKRPVHTPQNVINPDVKKIGQPNFAITYNGG